MAKLNHFDTTGLIPSVDSLYTGPYTTRLRAIQGRSQYTYFHPHDNCRHGLASDHIRRRVCTALSRQCHLRSERPSLETGEWQMAILIGGDFFISIFLFFVKGVTWIALGCVAEVLPLVSAASLSIPPLFIYISFAS